VGADRFATKAKGREHAHDIYSSLQGELHPSRRVLVVTHKEGVGFFHEQHREHNFFHGFDVTHWGGGAVGSNTWRDFDTVVIASQFYRPQHWASNIIGASGGISAAIQSIIEAQGNETSKVGDLITGRLIADTLQAIFRIRLRKVMQTDGSSLPCDVFVLLPQVDARCYGRGQRIRDAIIQELPGAKVKDWELKKPRVGRPNGDPDQEAKEAKVWEWMTSQQMAFTKADLMEVFPFVKTDWTRIWRPRLADRCGHTFRAKVEEQFAYSVEGTNARWSTVRWTPRNKPRDPSSTKAA
jgi:hypothetical protein